MWVAEGGATTPRHHGGHQEKITLDLNSCIRKKRNNEKRRMEREKKMEREMKMEREKKEKVERGKRVEE